MTQTAKAAYIVVSHIIIVMPSTIARKSNFRGNPQISLRLHPELLSKAEEASRKDGINLQTFIRQALEKALEQIEG